MRLKLVKYQVENRRVLMKKVVVFVAIVGMGFVTGSAIAGDGFYTYAVDCKGRNYTCEFSPYWGGPMWCPAGTSCGGNRSDACQKHSGIFGTNSVPGSYNPISKCKHFSK